MIRKMLHARQCYLGLTVGLGCMTGAGFDCLLASIVCAGLGLDCLLRGLIALAEKD